MADGGHTLVIEGMSDRTLRGLEALAAAHGRPVADEAREALARSVRQSSGAGARPGQDWPALIANAERIAAMTPRGTVQANSTDLVREDRDNDEPWR